jgi:hypothetical protein
LRIIQIRPIPIRQPNHHPKEVQMVSSMMFAQQLAGAQDAQTARDEVTAPTYAESLEKLITIGNLSYHTWLPKMDATLAIFGGGLTLRTTSERAQSTEATQLDEGIAAAAKLMGIARSVLTQANRKQLPGAAELYDQVPAPSSIDSIRTAGWELMLMMQVFDGVDLGSLGFKPGYYDRCKAVAAKLGLDRTQQVWAQVGITVGASRVHAAILVLAELMEELNDAREVVLAETGIELPGFDLRMIRAAAAGRPVPAEPAPAQPNGL